MSKKLVQIIKFNEDCYGIEDLKTHSSATYCDSIFSSYDKALKTVQLNNWTLHVEK